MNIRKNIWFCITLALFTTAKSSVLLADTSANGIGDTQTREIVEILPEDFRPAFTRDTMIKLNAIVKRSYAVVQGFDNMRRELNSTSSDHDTAMNALKLHSQFALNDMHKAAVALKTSNEHYNVAVLAGMVMFVETVDQEIKQFIEKTESVQRL